MEFLKEPLGDELYNQVAAKLKGNDKIKLANLADGGYVGKEKFDASETTITDLRKQLADRDKDIATLKKSAGDNEALTKQLGDLQIKYKTDTDVLQNKISQNALNAALDLGIAKANAVKKFDVDLIDKANNEYNKLTDHGKHIVDPTLKTKLDEVIKALRKLFIVHEATGTKVEGIDGTDFDVKTELVVTPVKETLGKETQTKFALSVACAAKGQEIAQLYDVKLLLNGQPIQPDGKVKITLKLTDEQQNYKDLQVIYIAGDGTVTVIPCEINGNEVSFITDHFSYYGIIGTPIKPSSGDKTTPDTGDNMPVMPCKPKCYHS